MDRISQKTNRLCIEASLSQDFRSDPVAPAARFEGNAIFLKLFMTISKDDRKAVVVAIDRLVFRLELFD